MDNQGLPNSAINVRQSAMTYSKSTVPFFGALIDYLDTSFHYLRTQTLKNVEDLHFQTSRARLSSSFLAGVCLLLGLVSNVKFEIVTMDDEPLPRDLPFMLMSKNDKLYIDDIDLSRVMWCIEASDCLVILISTLLIRTSSNVRSPLSAYMYLPWMGATLRGLFLRQAPTAGALIYTMAMINGNVNSIFVTAFTFLFLLEARLWLEIARLVTTRWQRSIQIIESIGAEYNVETLWSQEDSRSVEMNNFVY